MYIDGSDTFIEATFRTRLRDMFGEEVCAEGLSADMVSDAIVADRRLADVAASELSAIDDDVIVQGFQRLLALLLLGAEGGSIDLPFGTKATSPRPGSIDIGVQRYVVIAGETGLHEVEGVRRDAHGHNLDLLRAHVERRTRLMKCRRLGLPGPAAIYDNQQRHLLQFPPCDAAGGVVLQREAYETGADRFCSATPEQIAAFADEIVDDMQALWHRREEIAARASEVRAIVEREIASDEADGSVSLKAIAIDMRQTREGHTPPLYVELHGLDEALRPGTVLDQAPSRLGHWDAPAIRKQHYRREAVRRLEQQGADGRIGDVAAALAAAAPGGTVAALAPLICEQESTFAITTARGSLRVTLFWCEGTVSAEATLPGVLEWSHSELDVTRDCLPAEEFAAMIGRPVAEVVDLPFVLRSIVTDARELDNGFRLELEEKEAFVHLASGRIW